MQDMLHTMTVFFLSVGELYCLPLHSQAYLRQYGYLNDPADPQDPYYLEEVIEALR